ncbi:ATP-binding protein [uncultured Victivallis sp.]|uniref:ATP-binding protein n=1 Tax=uncultured Victivallis sp. TaxID=354118 RepID=UPI0025CF1CAF|nr:ATP-binding protein [uncultured Victivallis sp.]
MIKRKIQSVLADWATKFPVITITGPRQAGKTTLAQLQFPDYKYVNLEDPDIRLLAERDSREFLQQYSAPVIIDEVQRVPKLLSYIQVIVDQDRQKKGQFILTGSQQPNLRAEVSQSLAGRTAILQLLPLSIQELTEAGITMDRDEYLFKGFMPELYNSTIEPDLLYRNYYMTYVERDARQLINLRNSSNFELFIKLLAGRVGQLINLSSLSNDVGVSVSTLSEWLSVLEASHIVFRLPCYFQNFGKRLVKTPKLYFTEVGLATYLLGIKNVSQVARDPLFGGLFENMVVLEALKARYNAGKESELYFYRDSKGMEVDLLLNENRELLPMEIKAARSCNPDFAGAIAKFRSMVPNSKPGVVIYSGDLTPTIEDTRFVNFANTGNIIAE